MLATLGCQFEGVAERHFARQLVLQISAGLLDHFETRWGEAPYSLLLLAEEGVPEREKRLRATAFLEKPEHCLSMFLQKLKCRFPSVSSLVRDGGAILRALNESTRLGIDFTERC